MKLLLCISDVRDVEEFLGHYLVERQIHSSFKYLSTAKILHHQVHIIQTGAGVFQTAYKVTKALTEKKYHLALKVGFGNSYKEEISVGTVLNIINEKPGDFGMFTGGEWKDLYDFGLLNREAQPHVRGGFINLNTAYMNVFAPYKKAVSVTVNNYGDKSSFQLRREKYKADCETGDGLGFVYPCLFEKQNFYQLCVIERNLAAGEEDFPAAKKAFSETLIDLMKKI